MPQLQGKTALITGASAPEGIGRAIAQRLVADGAQVVITDIDQEVTLNSESVNRLNLLKELVAEIEAKGDAAMALALDVTSAQSIETALAQVKARFGNVDILVNNAVLWRGQIISSLRHLNNGAAVLR